MNRVYNAVKLDFYTARSTLLVSAVTIIIAVVIGLATRQPIFASLFVMLFAVVSGGMVFSTHEKNHTEKLYGALPLTKSEMIAGRYLYALIIGAVYMVIACALIWLISILLKTTVNAVLFWGALAISFLYYCFAVGVCYAVFFFFVFAKANVFTMLPMYLLVIGFMLLNRRTDFASKLYRFIQFFADNRYLIPICGLLGGLVLLTLSALIANLLYTRKEL
jgi:ABC-type transport system involved in multi-copper enzyme maturation permease subunit